MLLTLFASEVRGLASLRLGVSYQPGFDWSADVGSGDTGEPAAERDPQAVAGQRRAGVAYGRPMELLGAGRLRPLPRGAWTPCDGTSAPARRLRHRRRGGAQARRRDAVPLVVRLRRRQGAWRAPLPIARHAALPREATLRLAAAFAPGPGAPWRAWASVLDGALRQRAAPGPGRQGRLRGPGHVVRDRMEVLSGAGPLGGVACRRSALAGLVARPARRPRAEAPADVVERGCPPERAQNGEVRLVFLGDSGYGQGFAEWGAHGQEAIAAQINDLRLAPDLVLFLGDNIYWRGQQQALQVALRRHVRPADPAVQGPRGARQPRREGLPRGGAVERGSRALSELRTALLADRKARYVRQGLTEDDAAAKAEADTPRRTPGELAAQARRRARRTACQATPPPTRTSGPAGDLQRFGGAFPRAVRLRQAWSGATPRRASASATTASCGRCRS